jgi:hypothetical protein
MIYLKKPDGTIEQFENDRRHALDIDREIQGESFGEIHTADSLPDADKLKLKLITQKEIDAKIKLNRIAEIKSELASIDNQTIRALRAKTSGKGVAADDAKIKELDDKSDVLRAELQALES